MKMIRITIYLKTKKLLSELIGNIKIYLINNNNISFVIKEKNDEVFNTCQIDTNLDNYTIYECSIYMDENYNGEMLSYLIEVDNKGIPGTIFGLINNQGNFGRESEVLKKNKLFDNYDVKILDPFEELSTEISRDFSKLNKIGFDELFTSKKYVIFVKRNYILFLEGILRSFKKVKQERSIKDYFAKMFVSFQSTKSLSTLDKLFLGEYVFDNNNVKVFLSHSADWTYVLNVCNFVKNYFLFS